MHRTSPTFGKRSSAEPRLDCHRADPHCTIEAPSPAYGWATACRADEWWETNGTCQLVSSYLPFSKNFLPADLLTTGWKVWQGSSQHCPTGEGEIPTLLMRHPRQFAIWFHCRHKGSQSAA